jgi:hypothetical protein
MSIRTRSPSASPNPVPFRITTNCSEALRHRVVLVYPVVSGSVLSAADLQALAAHARQGGTLAAVNVLGGLTESFGIGEAVPSRTRFGMSFEAAPAERFGLTDPREQTLQLGDRRKQKETLGT